MRIDCFFFSTQLKKIHPIPINETPQKDNPVTHPKSSEKYEVSPAPENHHPMSTFDTKDPQALLNILITNYLNNKETTEDETRNLIKKAMIDFLNNLNIPDKKNYKNPKYL